MRWFTSDLHYHHRNIIKFTNRPTTPEEHTDWLVNLWNNQVRENDTVYHLGDFTFSREPDKINSVITRLNGEKIFITGNHDPDFFNKLHHEVYSYKEIRIDRTKVILFHYPILSFNGQHHGNWHLHGHCHGNLRKENVRGKMLDVGLDNAYNLYGIHKFFSERDIATYMNKQEIYIADNHEDRRKTE